MRGPPGHHATLIRQRLIKLNLDGNAVAALTVR
jgi:hypothetical protein